MSEEEENTNSVENEEETEIAPTTPQVDDGGGDDTLEWSAYYDADGRIYYYNSVSGESAWEAPEKFNPPPPQGADEQADDEDGGEPAEEAAEDTAAADEHQEAKWVKYEDDEGREYYYNNLTGETQWDKPEGFVEEDESGIQPEEPIEQSDAVPMETDEQQEIAKPQEPTVMELEPEEEIDPEVKRLQEAEKALERPDAVMEPNCLEHVHNVLSNYGPQEGAQKATQALIDSYSGDAAVCGLLGLWLAELKSSTSLAEGITKEDSFNSAADEVRDVAQDNINKIAKESFTKAGGDDILGLSKAEAAFLEEMIDSERWRKLLIDLSATQKDSALLMYCLQSISQRGHHREIAKRVNQSDHFSVYNAMLASEFAVVAAAASSGASSTQDSSIGMEELVEDLRRTCTSTSYTYLYAIELLKDLVSKAEQEASSDSQRSEQLQGPIRKWRRLREELEGAMVDPSITSGASGSSTLFRNRRLDTALAVSELQQRQQRRKEPGGEELPDSNHRLDRLDSCLLKLLRKHAVGSPLDDGLLEQLLRTDDGSENGVGGMLIQYPLAIKALLSHLFKPGSSRVSSMVTRNKCARLIALSVVSSQDSVQPQRPKHSADNEEEESEAEAITRMLLTASQLCELLENMVSFVVSRDTAVGDDASAGAKLSALCLKSATIAQGVVLWATEVTHNPEFVASPSYPTLSPSILSLVRIISDQHPFTRRSILNIGLVFLRHSNSEISYQKMNALKEQALRLLLFLLVHGEIISVLGSITARLREHGKSEIDASLIRYFVGGLLEIIRPPYSLSLVRHLGNMLTASRCMDALRSSYFADKKKQLVELVDNLSETVKKSGGSTSAEDSQLASTLVSIYKD